MPGPNPPTFAARDVVTAAQLNGLLDSTITHAAPKTGQIAVDGADLKTAGDVDILAGLPASGGGKATGTAPPGFFVPAVSVGQNYQPAELNRLAANGVRYGRTDQMRNVAQGELVLDQNNKLLVRGSSSFLAFRRTTLAMAAIANVSQLASTSLSVTLPAAIGGSGKFTYALSGAPSWVRRSGFNLTGIFEYSATAWQMTWRATDQVTGLSVSQRFTLQSTGIPLAAPTVSVSNILNDRFTVSWNDVQNATGYQYRYAAGSAAPTGNWSSTIQAQSVLVTGLSASTTYQIQVRSAGSGEYLTSSPGSTSATTVNVKLDRPVIRSFTDGFTFDGRYVYVSLHPTSHSGNVPARYPGIGNWPDSVVPQKLNSQNEWKDNPGDFVQCAFLFYRDGEVASVRRLRGGTLGPAWYTKAGQRGSWRMIAPGFNPSDTVTIR